MKRCTNPDCVAIVNERGRHIRLGDQLFCSNTCAMTFLEKERKDKHWKHNKIPNDEVQLQLPL